MSNVSGINIAQWNSIMNDTKGLQNHVGNDGTKKSADRYAVAQSNADWGKELAAADKNKDGICTQQEYIEYKKNNAEYKQEKNAKTMANMFNSLQNTLDQESATKMNATLDDIMNTTMKSLNSKKKMSAAGQKAFFSALQAKFGTWGKNTTLKGAALQTFIDEQCKGKSANDQACIRGFMNSIMNKQTGAISTTTFRFAGTAHVLQNAAGITDAGKFDDILQAVRSGKTANIKKVCGNLTNAQIQGLVAQMKQLGGVEVLNQSMYEANSK